MSKNVTADAIARVSPMSRAVTIVRDYGTIMGMVVVAAILGLIKPQILSPANLASVAEQSAYPVILATGLSLVMIMRGVDLSVAQLSDATGVIAALLLVQGQPMWLVFVAPMVFALAVGTTNGLLMAYLGVPAIIGTLGMMFVIRSFELVISNGRQTQVLFTMPPEVTGPFLWIGQGRIGPMPVAIVIGVTVVAIAWFLTRRTSYGRYVDAVGGNVRAAFLAGVPHRLVFAAGFVLSALAAGTAGMVLTARTGIAVPGAFESNLLDGFVAVYLGMSLVPSGRINVIGTAIGALFVGLIGNALTLLGLGIAAKYVVYGGVIIVAMAIGVLRRNQAQ